MASPPPRPAVPTDVATGSSSRRIAAAREDLLTATQIHKFVKINNTIGWMGHGYSALGAVVTAVVPDA